MNEQKIMEQAVSRVATRLGFTKPIRVMPNREFALQYDPFSLFRDPSPAGDVYALPALNLIGYGEGTTDLGWSEAMLDAIIAHEIKHLIDGPHQDISDSVQYKREEAADKFAVAHGYGAGLLAALAWGKDSIHFSNREDGSHPTISKREATIRREMAKLPKAAYDTA